MNEYSSAKNIKTSYPTDNNNTGLQDTLHIYQVQETAAAAEDILVADSILADSLEEGSIQQEVPHTHSHTVAEGILQVEEDTVAAHLYLHIHTLAVLGAY